MKNTEFMTKVSRTFGRLGLQCKKHAPEALVAAGVVGVVVSAVMACKATTKVNDIIEDANEQLEPIHNAKEKLKAGEELRVADGSEYTLKDNTRDTIIIYTKTGLKLIKLYAPSVVLGALSLTAIITSHRILTKRNVALAAAYTAEQTMFREYRGRVVDRFGEELDKELRYNLKSQEVETVTIHEDGSQTIEKSTVNMPAGPELDSTYAKYFNRSSSLWVEGEPMRNAFIILQQQRFLNDKLKNQGHLFLNEVYDAFDIPRTPAGQVVGWIYDKKNEGSGDSDNFVEVIIFPNNPALREDFINGRVNPESVLLDFNVDGVVYNKIR